MVLSNRGPLALSRPASTIGFMTFAWFCVRSVLTGLGVVGVRGKPCRSTDTSSRIEAT